MLTLVVVVCGKAVTRFLRVFGGRNSAIFVVVFHSDWRSGTDWSSTTTRIFAVHKLSFLCTRNNIAYPNSNNAYKLFLSQKVISGKVSY
jgi:hypothetical protein